MKGGRIEPASFHNKVGKKETCMEVTMRKLLVILLGLILIPFGIFAADRVTLLEIFTSTGCGACPSAANSAENLGAAHPGEVLIVEHHVNAYGDQFYNAEGSGRAGLYQIKYLPTAIFDGVDWKVGGNEASQYESAFQTRKALGAPLEIDLTRIATAYSSTTGTLRAVITNTSEETISGSAYMTISESHIPYSWGGLSHLHWVQRTMLPSWGQSVNLGPGEHFSFDQDFTLDDTWPYFTEDGNCEFGCFVQGPDKEIHQAAVLEYGDPIDVEEDDDSPLSLLIPRCRDCVLLSLDVPTDAHISIFDVSGRNIEDIFSGSLPPGEHRLSIDTDRLSKGTYFVAAEYSSDEANALRIVEKLVILE